MKFCIFSPASNWLILTALPAGSVFISATGRQKSWQALVQLLAATACIPWMNLCMLNTFGATAWNQEGEKRNTNKHLSSFTFLGSVYFKWRPGWTLAINTKKGVINLEAYLACLWLFFHFIRLFSAVKSLLKLAAAAALVTLLFKAASLYIGARQWKHARMRTLALWFGVRWLSGKLLFITNTSVGWRSDVILFTSVKGWLDLRVRCKLGLNGVMVLTYFHF